MCVNSCMLNLCVCVNGDVYIICVLMFACVVYLICVSICVVAA